MDKSEHYAAVAMTFIVALAVVCLVGFGFKTAQTNSVKNEKQFSECLAAGGSWVYDSCIVNRNANDK